MDFVLKCLWEDSVDVNLGNLKFINMIIPIWFMDYMGNKNKDWVELKYRMRIYSSMNWVKGGK